MADNFNLAKFLSNNQLLNEGIGGYKDVVPYAGAEEKLDGFGDEFDPVDPVEEGDDEQAYFDYKRSGEDSDVSWDDFDRPEVQKYDRMMGLAHEEFMGISDIVSMTIDSLRHGGFDDQDILNFLATDFSLDEGLDEAEMGGEEFDWKPIDQQGKTPFKNLTVTITGDEMKVKSDDGFDSQSYTKDDIKDAMKTGEYLRFRGKNLELNTKMKAWANS